MPARTDADFERLALNIREELQAQNTLQGLGLDEDTLRGLSDAVAVNITYAFDVKWSPKWVKPGEAHYWSEPSDETATGENHYVECVLCQWVSTHNATRRDAEQKFGRHFQREHRTGA